MATYASYNPGDPNDPQNKNQNVWPLLAQAKQMPPDQAQVMQSVGVPASEPPPTPGTVAPSLASYFNPLDKAENEGYKKAADQAQAQQEAGLGKIQDYIKGIQDTPTGINLSPLAAYFDAHMGGHLADAANKVAPMSQDDKQKLLLDAQMKLQNQRGTLTQENLKSLGQQLQMQQTSRHQAAMEQHWMDQLKIDQQKADAMGGTNGAGGRVGQMANKQATDAGKAFDTNHIIQTSQDSLNSLVRSKSILDNPNKPVTSKDLNLAYNDYINAVAKGGAATEGKISRELPDTFEQHLNEWRQKFGDNADMRASPAGQELVKMLHENIRTVRMDLGYAVSDQAKRLEQNYRAITNNEAMQKVVDAKMALYGDPLKAAGLDAPAAPSAPKADAPMSFEQFMAGRKTDGK